MLAAGVGMPVLYFVALFAAGAFYPDFSHVRQPASDLGAVDAPYQFASAFNVSLVAVGVMGLFGSLGLSLGLRNLGVAGFLSLVCGIVPAMPSLSIVISGVFPLPSPYHSSFLLLIAGIFTPMVGSLALRNLPSTGPIRLTLLAAFAGTLVVLGILLGIGDLVTEDNLGLWFRIWAAVSLPAMGFLCFAVRDRLTTITPMDLRSDA